MLGPVRLGRGLAFSLIYSLMVLLEFRGVLYLHPQADKEHRRVRMKTNTFQKLISFYALLLTPVFGCLNMSFKPTEFG